jgi:hypothetical protein
MNKPIKVIGPVATLGAAVGIGAAAACSGPTVTRDVPGPTVTVANPVTVTATAPAVTHTVIAPAASCKLTQQLSGAPAHVILHLPGNMVITQELLSLSFTLGGLAILSFAFVTLSDRRARPDFVSTASSGLRNVLLAFTVYQAALENEPPLTGASSQPLDKP